MQNVTHLLKKLRRQETLFSFLKKEEQELIASLTWRLASGFLGENLIGPGEWAKIHAQEYWKEFPGAVPCFPFLNSIFEEQCLFHYDTVEPMLLSATHSAFLGKSAIKGTPTTIKNWRKRYRHQPGANKQLYFAFNEDTYWYQDQPFAEKELDERWSLLLHHPLLFYPNSNQITSDELLSVMLNKGDDARRDMIHGNYKFVEAVVYVSFVLMFYEATGKVISNNIPVICEGECEDSEFVSVTIGNHAQVVISSQFNPSDQHGLVLERAQ